MKKSIIVSVLFFAMAALVATRASAEPLRPPNVPAAFEATPQGYFSPTCLHHLEEGDFLNETENTIIHASGAIESIPVCAFPHYDSGGAEVSRHVGRCRWQTSTKPCRHR